MSEQLNFQSVNEHPELVSESVFRMANNLQGIKVAEIDPVYAGGQDLCDHYGISLDEGANCVVVEATRGEKKTIAACLVPVDYKIDFNSIVRKHLNARKVSLAPLDFVLSESGMELGSITPVGLPASWRILMDSRLKDKNTVIIGGGLKKSKIQIPVSVLLNLPNIEIVENLAKKK